MELEQIARQLFVSLCSMPCRCTRKWNKNHVDGYEVTHFCSRYMAIEAYAEYRDNKVEA